MVVSSLKNSICVNFNVNLMNIEVGSDSTNRSSPLFSAKSPSKVFERTWRMGNISWETCSVTGTTPTSSDSITSKAISVA